MKQSAIALATHHNVPYIELDDHVEDLITRFANRQLGDTVKRVGNDINRKLNPNDRIIGALNMCLSQGVTPKYICLAAAAAMNFKHDELSQKPATELLSEIAKIDADSEAGKLILEFDAKIKEGGISFGIAVLDINNLKSINDTYGHILGNELIALSSRIICDTFKKSPIFRIGGDEFCVILQNRDLSDIKTLFERFDAECAATCLDKDTVKLPISIAKGFAEFDPDQDTQFSDVFERADSEMYQNKKHMKSSNS
jgi:diguanylate cyclase (GGDEF)-like protein